MTIKYIRKKREKKTVEGSQGVIDMLIVSDMLKVKMKICLFVCIPDMKIENTTGHIMAQVGRFICTYFSISSQEYILSRILNLNIFIFLGSVF